MTSYFGNNPATLGHNQLPLAVLRPVPPPNVIQPGITADQPNPATPVAVVPDAPAA